MGHAPSSRKARVTRAAIRRSTGGAVLVFVAVALVLVWLQPDRNERPLVTADLAQVEEIL
jgi:preprotein translocase subunit SecG